MVFRKNESGVTMIEGLLVLALFCILGIALIMRSSWDTPPTKAVAGKPGTIDIAAREGLPDYMVSQVDVTPHGKKKYVMSPTFPCCRPWPLLSSPVSADELVQAKHNAYVLIVDEIEGLEYENPSCLVTYEIHYTYLQTPEREAYPLPGNVTVTVDCDLERLCEKSGGNLDTETVPQTSPEECTLAAAIKAQPCYAAQLADTMPTGFQLGAEPANPMSGSTFHLGSKYEKGYCLLAQTNATKGLDGATEVFYPSPSSP